MISREFMIPERLIPSELDLSDPIHCYEYYCHVNKYRFASLFVEGKRVIDIGCGAGYGSMILRETGGAASVLGIDIDEEIIALARREYAAEGITFIRLSFDEIASPEKYDFAVSINTLEYLPDPEYFLSYVKSILKKDGELIVSAHTTPTTDFNPYIIHDFTRQKLKRMIKKAGFRISHEFLQINHYKPGKALELMKHKKTDKDISEKNRSLIFYYLAHPIKAFRRVKSLIAHGLTIKTLTIHAELE